MSLVREDEDGLYLVHKSTIYRPPSPLTIAKAGLNVRVSSKGVLSSEVYTLYTDDKPAEFTWSRLNEPAWEPKETLAEYKARKKSDSEWTEWKDFLGNTYRPGEYVVYAAMYGQSACLKFGRVLRINKNDSSGKPHQQYDYKARARIPGASVTIEVLENSGATLFRRSERNTTILDLSKVVKIEGSYMQKFEELETSLVDAEVERIKEKYT